MGLVSRRRMPASARHKASHTIASITRDFALLTAPLKACRTNGCRARGSPHNGLRARGDTCRRVLAPRCATGATGGRDVEMGD